MPIQAVATLFAPAHLDYMHKPTLIWRQRLAPPSSSWLPCETALDTHHQLPTTPWSRTASVMAPALGSPPRASLECIPPELRNNIYHKVAEDIDEASIVGRKIDGLDPNWTDAEAEDRMWHAIAKHPLSQTCRKLRKEFSPIHRHYAITKGVPKYYLELENYDMDRME